LGLAICRMIVQRHGGQLSLAPRPRSPPELGPFLLERDVVRKSAMDFIGTIPLFLCCESVPKALGTFVNEASKDGLSIPPAGAVIRVIMLGRSRAGTSAMSVIPLHLQRRFEQRWAARVASLVGASALKNVVSKGSAINGAPRATRAKEGPARLRRRKRPSHGLVGI
jgi:hypothetical protein